MAQDATGIDLQQVVDATTQGTASDATYGTSPSHDTWPSRRFDSSKRCPTRL